MPQLLSSSKEHDERVHRMANTTRLRSMAPTGAFRFENNVIKFTGVAIGAMVAAGFFYLSVPLLNTLMPAQFFNLKLVIAGHLIYFHDVLRLIPALIGFLIGAGIASKALGWLLNKVYIVTIDRRR